MLQKLQDKKAPSNKNSNNANNTNNTNNKTTTQIQITENPIVNPKNNIPDKISKKIPISSTPKNQNDNKRQFSLGDDNKRQLSVGDDYKQPFSNGEDIYSEKTKEIPERSPENKNLFKKVHENTTSKRIFYPQPHKTDSDEIEFDEEESNFYFSPKPVSRPQVADKRRQKPNVHSHNYSSSEEFNLSPSSNAELPRYEQTSDTSYLSQFKSQKKSGNASFRQPPTEEEAFEEENDQNETQTYENEDEEEEKDENRGFFSEIDQEERNLTLELEALDEELRMRRNNKKHGRSYNNMREDEDIEDEEIEFSARDKEILMRILRSSDLPELEVLREKFPIESNPKKLDSRPSSRISENPLTPKARARPSSTIPKRIQQQKSASRPSSAKRIQEDSFKDSYVRPKTPKTPYERERERERERDRNVASSTKTPQHFRNENSNSSKKTPGTGLRKSISATPARLTNDNINESQGGLSSKKLFKKEVPARYMDYVFDERRNPALRKHNEAQMQHQQQIQTKQQQQQKRAPSAPKNSNISTNASNLISKPNDNNKELVPPESEEQDADLSQPKTVNVMLQHLLISAEEIQRVQEKIKIAEEKAATSLQKTIKISQVLAPQKQQQGKEKEKQSVQQNLPKTDKIFNGKPTNQNQNANLQEDLIQKAKNAILNSQQIQMKMDEQQKKESEKQKIEKLEPKKDQEMQKIEKLNEMVTQKALDLLQQDKIKKMEQNHNKKLESIPNIPDIKPKMQNLSPKLIPQEEMEQSPAISNQMHPTSKKMDNSWTFRASLEELARTAKSIATYLDIEKRDAEVVENQDVDFDYKENEHENENSFEKNYDSYIEQINSFDPNENQMMLAEQKETEEPTPQFIIQKKIKSDEKKREPDIIQNEMKKEVKPQQKIEKTEKPQQKQESKPKIAKEAKEEPWKIKVEKETPPKNEKQQEKEIKLIPQQENVLPQEEFKIIDEFNDSISEQKKKFEDIAKSFEEIIQMKLRRAQEKEKIQRETEMTIKKQEQTPKPTNFETNASNPSADANAFLQKFQEMKKKISL